MELGEYCKPLVGTELISVEKHAYSWFIGFGTGITVATESLWRLILDGRIVVTSQEDGRLRVVAALRSGSQTICMGGGEIVRLTTGRPLGAGRLK